MRGRDSVCEPPPAFAVFQGAVRRELEWRVELGFEPRYSSMGCGILCSGLAIAPEAAEGRGCFLPAVHLCMQTKLDLFSLSGCLARAVAIRLSRAHRAAGWGTVVDS